MSSSDIDCPKKAMSCSDNNSKLVQFCINCHKSDDVSQVLEIINRELIAEYGFLMLCHAIECDRVFIMLFLMNSYPNLITLKDEHGLSILAFAFIYGHYNCISPMLQHSPQLIRWKACDGCNIFHYAARRRDIPADLLNQLIECDQKTNSPLYMIDMPQRTTGYAIHVAAKCNNVLFLSRVHAIHPNMLLVHTIKNNTVLHIAVSHRHLDCVRYLLNVCPHLCKSQNADQFNPLHLAVCDENHEIVELLVACDTTIITSSTQSVFRYAMLRPNFTIINTLLTACPQVANERYDKKGNILVQNDARGETTLHIAVQNIYQKHIIGDLLRINPDLLQQVNHEGNTALYIANQHNNPEAIKAIIASRPDMSYTDNDNNTPLHFILCTDAPTELVMTVFHHNPSHMYTVNTKQRTPLHECITFYRNPEIFEPYLQLDFLLVVYSECKFDLSHLFVKVQNQFSGCCLLCELQNIVFYYIGF